jgi:hypothetical protein
MDTGKPNVYDSNLMLIKVTEYRLKDVVLQI